MIDNRDKGITKAFQSIDGVKAIAAAGVGAFTGAIGGYVSGMRGAAVAMYSTSTVKYQEKLYSSMGLPLFKDPINKVSSSLSQGAESLIGFGAATATEAGNQLFNITRAKLNKKNESANQNKGK